MKSSARNIQLSAVDDLFLDDLLGEESGERVVDIPLCELHSFKDYPVRVLDDDLMRETVESIREHGTIQPGIARPRMEGGYELISGHRRKRGCELAGLETMPVIIRELDDDEATLMMTDSAIQRNELLPSEKARLLKMKMEALKHQGKKLTLSQNETRRTDEVVGADAGISRATAQRLVRLTELIPPLLDMVDGKKLPLKSAENISYLDAEQQRMVLDAIQGEETPLSASQSETIKKSGQEGRLDAAVIQETLAAKGQAATFFPVQLHAETNRRSDFQAFGIMA